MASTRWPSHFTSYSQSSLSGSFSTGVASIGGMNEGDGPVVLLRCLVFVEGVEGVSLATVKLGTRVTRPSGREVFVVFGYFCQRPNGFFRRDGLAFFEEPFAFEFFSVQENLQAAFVVIA